MNIIIPMAGMGKRLRPHTLNTPKPLVKVCGEEIVKVLCRTIVSTCENKVDKIGFVVGNFGEKVEKELLQIAESLGAEGKIFYQTTPLGTADAIWCAKEYLQGNTIVAFADTLFKADFKMNLQQEGILWTYCVDNPQQFGVVRKNEQTGEITQFVEKPKEFVSKEALIGIYYFRDGKRLYKEIERLIDNNITKGGEYQLTDALENMLQNGFSFRTEQVKEWLDCGNKDAVIYTNQRLLALNMGKKEQRKNLQIKDSFIIEPCYIGENVKIESCIIGPYVSIENNVEIKNSVVKNSIIGQNSFVENVVWENTMTGESVHYTKQAENLSLGAYSNIQL
ncbi:MAG: hypothetical protein IJ213_04145 [Bacteroidales bacterium]|nr:hypothetical protein [Bacteroidales bacterium]